MRVVTLIFIYIGITHANATSICESFYLYDHQKVIIAGQAKTAYENSIWNKFNHENESSFMIPIRDYGFSLKMNKKFRGGEGQLFFSEKYSHLTLKRFFIRTNTPYYIGLNILRMARSSIIETSELSQYIDIAQIYEEGPDWIIRDFDADSVPLRNVMHDTDIQLVVQKAVKELKKNELNPYLKKVLKKIEKNPPSENVHWSNKSKKLLIFDMTLFINQIDRINRVSTT